MKKFEARIYWVARDHGLNDAGGRIKYGEFDTIEECRSFINKHKNLVNSYKAEIRPILPINEGELAYTSGQPIEKYTIKRR